MKSEVVEAIRMLAKEKEIDESRLFTMIEEALKAAYRKNSPRNEAVPSMLDVHVDRDTGAISVFAKKTIVEEVEMPTNQITLEEAQKLNRSRARQDLRGILRQGERDSHRYRPADRASCGLCGPGPHGGRAGTRSDDSGRGAA